MTQHSAVGAWVDRSKNVSLGMIAVALLAGLIDGNLALFVIIFGMGYGFAFLILRGAMSNYESGSIGGVRMKLGVFLVACIFFGVAFVSNAGASELHQHGFTVANVLAGLVPLRTALLV